MLGFLIIERMVDMIGGRSSPEAVEVTLEAMPEYSHLTRKERMKVAMLKKRVNFLKRRVEQSPNNLTWDAQEIAALTFALGYIASHDPNATGERLVSHPLDPIVGLIDCPQCGKQFDQTVCSCGYEHSCGGPSEACCIPGCSECCCVSESDRRN